MKTFALGAFIYLLGMSTAFAINWFDEPYQPPYCTESLQCQNIFITGHWRVNYHFSYRTPYKKFNGYKIVMLQDENTVHVTSCYHEDYPYNCDYAPIEVYKYKMLKDIVAFWSEDGLSRIYISKMSPHRMVFGITPEAWMSYPASSALGYRVNNGLQ